MSESEPAISIVVAAHNEERALPACLRSLAEARLAGARETIVVDNASTDGTAAVAAAHGARVIRCATLGAVHAKAAGVAAARAPLIAILDADSTCPPDWLEKIAAAFAREPSLVGLSGPARYRTRKLWVRIAMGFWFGFWKVLQLVFRRALYATGTNVAFRRETYERAGGFDTNVLVGGDEVALFRRLSRHGRTRFVDDLWVETDARRTDGGPFRFFWSVVFLRYMVNYWVYRLTGRSPIKGYLPGSKLR